MNASLSSVSSVSRSFATQAPVGADPVGDLACGNGAVGDCRKHAPFDFLDRSVEAYSEMSLAGRAKGGTRRRCDLSGLKQIRTQFG